FHSAESFPLHQRAPYDCPLPACGYVGTNARENAGRDDALYPPGRSQPADRVPAGWLQRRYEYWGKRRRRGGGSYPHARCPALDRRCQFHEHDRRNTRAAGGSDGDVRETRHTRLERIKTEVATLPEPDARRPMRSPAGRVDP